MPTHAFPIVLLLAAVIGSYWSTALLRGPRRRESPDSVAVAHSVRLLIVVVIAVLFRQPDVAIGVILGSCVVVAALAPAVAIWSSPRTFAPLAIGGELPIVGVAILWLCGFRGRLDAFDACALFGQTVVVISVADRFKGLRFARADAIVAAVAVAAVAAWAGLLSVEGVRPGVSIQDRRSLAAVLLAPALMMPLIAAAGESGRIGRTGDACAAAGRFVSLAIGVVLPTAIALTETLRGYGLTIAPIFLPPLAWRLDVVLIGVLLSALPLFARRTFGRAEAAGLFVVYALYLVATAALNARV